MQCTLGNTLTYNTIVYNTQHLCIFTMDFTIGYHTTRLLQHAEETIILVSSHCERFIRQQFIQEDIVGNVRGDLRELSEK